MKLIIDIEKDTYEEICESCKFFTEFECTPNLYQTIANGIPYDKVIDEVTELLENEWGYEGMKDDVSRIMKGGADMRKPNCVRCDHFGNCDGCERGKKNDL